MSKKAPRRKKTKMEAMLSRQQAGLRRLANELAEARAQFSEAEQRHAEQASVVEALEKVVADQAEATQ